MSGKRKTGICIFCGQERFLTKDHIPPKSLFPRPRPNNLITVCSCEDCNLGTGKDDEYFRLMTTIREDALNHPEANRILEVISRSFERVEHNNLRLAVLKTLKYVERVSPSGLYLGTRPSFEQDYARLNKLVAKITQGLFYHEKGYRLPDSHSVEAWGDPFIRDKSDSERNQRIISFLLSQKRITIGNGVFSYWTAFRKEDLNTSAWLILFFESVPYLCVTCPRKDDTFTGAA